VFSLFPKKTIAIFNKFCNVFLSGDYIGLREITPHYAAASQAQPNAAYENDGKLWQYLLYNLWGLEGHLLQTPLAHGTTLTALYWFYMRTRRPFITDSISTWYYTHSSLLILYEDSKDIYYRLH